MHHGDVAGIERHVRGDGSVAFRVVWRDPTQPGKQARAAFDRLTPSKQKAHVLAVEGAKTEETRARRVAKVCDELLH